MKDDDLPHSVTAHVHMGKFAITAIVTAIVAVLIFIGAYVAGRMTVNPADTAEYQDVTTRIANAKQQTEVNKDASRQSADRLKELQEQQQTADKQLQEAKQEYERYVPAGSVADQPLKVESFDVTIVPNEIGSGTYIHPKFVVRNTSGHVITKIEIIGDIVKPDGTVVDSDQSVSADDIRFLPGKTAVVAKDLIAKGAAGDLFRPKHYYYQTYGDSQFKNVQFGSDVAAKVIS